MGADGWAPSDGPSGGARASRWGGYARMLPDEGAAEPAARAHRRANGAAAAEAGGEEDAPFSSAPSTPTRPAASAPPAASPLARDGGGGSSSSSSGGGGSSAAAPLFRPAAWSRRVTPAGLLGAAAGAAAAGGRRSARRSRAAARCGRSRTVLLCSAACCVLTCAVSMLLVCVAFTGEIKGPLVPLVIDVLASITGLTVADDAFTAWVTEPVAALPTVVAPAPILGPEEDDGADAPAETAAAAAAASRRRRGDGAADAAGGGGGGGGGSEPLGSGGTRTRAARPNVLIYLADDMGYADPHAFSRAVLGVGNNNTTPNLDALGAQGLMLTHYLTEPICTPARAALLTGRYPHRYGMTGDVLPQRVVYTPGAPSGLPKREITIARALKAAGYRTALSGKWHLGISAASSGAGTNGTNTFLPAHHGFDDSLVWPFSNFQKCNPYSEDGEEEEAPAGGGGGGGGGGAAARPPAGGGGGGSVELRTRRAAERRARALSAREEGAEGADPPAPLDALDEAEEAEEAAEAEEAEAEGGPVSRALLRFERLLGRQQRKSERSSNKDERKAERTERRSARHNHTDLARRAANAFAREVGLSGGPARRRGGSAGVASNGMFCFLMANNTIIQQPAHMFGLQEAMVRHADAFIRRAAAAASPWFLYYADLHPHTVLFNHPRFGPGPPGPFHSSNGQYGQVMKELDWALGELLTAVDEVGAAEDTLVVFTSDNGPYQEEGWAQSGRKGGLKGGKGQLWEGGIRVPAIVRWPGVVPAGAVSDAPVRALDLLPTIAAFAGVALPPSLLLDGVDQSRFFQRPTDAHNGWLASRRVHFHYCGIHVLAARYLGFKVFWRTQKWQEGYEGTCTQCCPRAGYTAGLFGSTTLCQCDAKSLERHDPPLVFDVRNDPNETTPLRPGTHDHARAVQEANAALEAHRATLDPSVPCVNCPLPIPLKTWPCCDGSLPQCPDQQCGLGGRLGAACTYSLIADRTQLGSGRCECNRCPAEGDCGTGWA